MTEFQAKKVYLKDGEGDYIAPVAYSSSYTNENHLNIESELNNKLSYNQVTNCIIETPQNLFWEEIENGVRLKAGSKITVPNGFETDGTTLKFDTIVTTEDLDYTYTGSNTVDALLVYRTDTGVLTRTLLSSAVSGSTAPTNGLWYDTTTNKVVQYDSGTSSFEASLPLGVYNLGARKLIQSFNHMGFIGSIYFVLDGTKFLLADGRNADGSLKNEVLNITTPSIFDVTNVSSSNSDRIYYGIYRFPTEGHTEWITGLAATVNTRIFNVTNTSELPSPIPQAQQGYVSSENQWYVSSSNYSYTTRWTSALNRKVLPIKFKFDSTGMYIESMQIPDTISLLNNDLSNLSAIGEAKFDTKLNKSGDTMTGTLQFDKSVVPALHTQLNHTVSADNPPVSNTFVRTEYTYDNANKLLYSERLRLDTNNAIVRYFTVTNYDAQGQSHVAEVGLRCYTDGSTGFSFPNCATAPTTTSTASTSRVIVGTKNYLNGEAGYVKYSDGLIIQWGKTAQGANQKVALLQSYTNANYFVGTTQYYTNYANADYGAITAKTKDGFEMKGYANISFGWFAIGY